MQSYFARITRFWYNYALLISGHQQPPTLIIVIKSPTSHILGKYEGLPLARAQIIENSVQTGEIGKWFETNNILPLSQTFCIFRVGI